MARIGLEHELGSSALEDERRLTQNGWMAIWKRVRYTGRVQGVGFRYTARQLASGFAVDGYVRNLSTGDVEVLAGGDANDVGAFLAAIADRMAGYIEQTFEAESRPSDDKGFRIRY